MEANGADKLLKLENELKKMSLELAHSKENYENILASTQKQISLMENQMNQRLREFVMTKNQLNNEISMKDQQEIDLRKTIKTLNLQLHNLKEEIFKYNKKMK